MTDVEATWASRELPILRAALRRIDAGARGVELAEIQQETGLSSDEMWAGISALKSADPPYIDVHLSGGWGTEASGLLTDVSERTRRELGSWPSAESLVDQLAQALRVAAEQEEEPQRRSRLSAAAETLGSVAREVAIKVLSEYLIRKT